MNSSYSVEKPPITNRAGKGCVQGLVLLLYVIVISTIQANETTSGQGAYTGDVDTVYPDWFKVSFMELEDDIAEAAAQDKRVMLLFHQEGCPYCNAFVERNLAQIDIENTLKTKFDVFEINMWGDREIVSVNGEVFTEKEFSKALQVQFTPTILFLTEEGNVALRLNGYYDPDRFRVAMDYVANKLETNSTESSKTLVARDYFTGSASEINERPGKGAKPLLLLFEQGSCRNCETLHNDILAKPESQKLLSRFDVYQIDIWGRDLIKSPEGAEVTGRQLSRELNISYAPTMVLYAADGTEVIRAESQFKTFHTQSILDYVVSDGWQTESNFQRYLSARVDSLRDKGIDVNIWD